MARGTRFTLRAFVLVALALGAGCSHGGGIGAVVPRLDHVVVIVMENKSYDEVRSAPFIASLITGGALFTQSFAVAHPSQPNYLALWSGSTQGVAGDQCPAPGSPFRAENLGHACEAAGLAWRAYCENLPAPGSAACSTTDGYVRRHAPWTDFANVDHANERPLADLDADVAQGALPALAFVIPNLCDDMHTCPVAQGDAWLAGHVPALLAAIGAHGLLVLTWDERDTGTDNHILTVFAGGAVRAGAVSSRPITHTTVLRTITAALGLVPFGRAVHETPIGDVWAAPPVTPATAVTPTPPARAASARPTSRG